MNARTPVSTRCRRRAVKLLCAAVVALGASGPCWAGESRARLALLVGVSEYPGLGASEQLDGCENDVAAMRTLLTERFGFSAQDIVTLVNAQATGDRIRQEWALLIARLNALGEQSEPPIVVVHFSGHGSQVADQTPDAPGFDELDGLDETLVPCDATRQGGPQDIRDDELYDFVQQACETHQAKVWVVLDCCHSGTGARGATKLRKLERGDLNPLRPDKDSMPPPRRLPPGAVVLSACQPHEVEPEYLSEGVSYGLLTRFLVEAINREANLSKVSYDLLREAIVARYRSDRAVVQAPTPVLEYGDVESLRESIIDGVGIDRRPLWQVRRERGATQLTMQAGALHGVTVGSLYEVYNAPDQVQWTPEKDANQSGASACWLEVQGLEGASATCGAFRWRDGRRTAVRLPPSWVQGFAILRHAGRDDSRLRVRVVRATGARRDSAPLTAKDDVPQAVLDVFDTPQQPPADWLDWATGDAGFDFVLRIDGGYAALFPASGIASLPQPDQRRVRGQRAPRTLAGGWGPVNLRDRQAAAAELRAMLRRITRARNLIAIASRASQPSTVGGTAALAVQLELLRVDEADENYTVTKAHPWRPQDQAGQSSDQLVMRDGEEFAFRVTNGEPSGKPIYITVLQVDSNMAIDQIHPWQPSAGAVAEGEQRLEAGQSMIPPGYFVCNGEPDEPPVYGRRWAVVLATRTPNNFHLLAQRGLPVTRGTRSPLEDLLREAVDLKTRGGFSRRRRPSNQYDHSWGAMVVEWEVIPE